MSHQPPIIEYSSPGTTTRPSKTGIIGLRLGVVAALMLVLLGGGVFAGDASIAWVGLTVLAILTALGFGVVGLIDKNALAIPATVLASADLIGFISLAAYFLSHLPLC